MKLHNVILGLYLHHAFKDGKAVRIFRVDTDLYAHADTIFSKDADADRMRIRFVKEMRIERGSINHDPLPPLVRFR